MLVGSARNLPVSATSSPMSIRLLRIRLEIMSRINRSDFLPVVARKSPPYTSLTTRASPHVAGSEREAHAEPRDARRQDLLHVVRGRDVLPLLTVEDRRRVEHIE